MDYESIELPGAPRSTPATMPTGADHRQLVKAITENHARWFTTQSLARGGEARSVPGGVLTVAPNEIMLAFPRIPEAGLDSYVEEFMSLCRERRPSRIGCWARDRKGYGSLGARLAARGFEWGWQAVWMALDLNLLRSDFPVPPGLRIQVTDQADWEVEDLPYYNRKMVSELHTLSTAQPRRTWHFGAWLDGKLVGQSILFLTTGRFGVGGIYNVGVVPSARNQGIGRAVSVAACYAARRCGARYAVLNAATHIYDRIGFETIGYGQTWWLHSEPLLHPPAAAEIAFAEAIGRGDVSALEGMTSLPDLDASLACGLRPIRFAVRCGKPSMVRWLVARGATLHILDAWDLGWKAEAARRLKAQPDLANARSGPWQLTPLHTAAERGDEELAKLLLTANPDLTIRDTQFKGTALNWARQFDRSGIIALIEGA